MESVRDHEEESVLLRNKVEDADSVTVKLLTTDKLGVDVGVQVSVNVGATVRVGLHRTESESEKVSVANCVGVDENGHVSEADSVNSEYDLEHDGLLNVNEKDSIIVAVSLTDALHV